MKFLNKIDEENICIDSILVEDSEVETQEKVDALISLLGLSGKYIAADENYIEGFYDVETGRLIQRKPFLSWILDSNGKWIPPVPHPQIEGVSHVWSESELEWVIVTEI